MAFDKEFFDCLEKLKNFKTKPELNDFFETLNRLERICEELNLQGKHKHNDPETLIKQAQDLSKKLDVNRDEFAFRTKTQKEFDAVYEVIDYLGVHVNSLN